MEKTKSQSCPIAQNKAISSSPIVIGGHIPLDMEPATSSGSENYCLSLYNKILLRLQIIKYRASAVAMLTQDHLYRRRKLKHHDVPAVPRLITDSPHNL